MLEEAGLKPGDLVAGRYLIEEKIGEGGMGAVFRARDQRNMGYEVAVKLLRSSIKQGIFQKTAKVRLSREQEAMLRIVHPNVVRVIESGEIGDGDIYLVQEFIHGESLGDRLKRDPKVEFDEVIKIITQVGAALQAAHSEGIVHRDLKPANVMLQKISGGGIQIKVIDFGIAKVDESTIDGQLTATGVILGTPYYASPEQMQGMPPDPKMDLWGLSVMAYELLTGIVPFKADTIATICIRQIEGAKPPRQFRPQIPPAAQSVILKSLQYLPEQRYQTIPEFCQALSAALSGPVPQPDLDVTSDSLPVAQPLDVTVDGTPKTGFTEMDHLAQIPSSAAQAMIETVNVQPAPPAKSDAAKSENANTVTQETDAVLLARSVQPTAPTVQSAAAKPDRTMLYAISGAALVLVIVVVAGVLYKVSRVDKPATPSPSASSAPAKPLQPITLSYRLFMQGDRGDPFYASGRGIYHNNDKFKFIVKSSEKTHLYIFNEGTDGALVLLFPVAHINNGSSLIEKDKEVSLPNEWFVFDNVVGEENLLVVLSAEPIYVMENLNKHVINDASKGTQDNDNVSSIREWLKQHDTTPKQRNEANETILSVTDQPLVAHITLQHR